jgi:hypothetical protein
VDLQHAQGEPGPHGRSRGPPKQPLVERPRRTDRHPDAIEQADLDHGVHAVHREIAGVDRQRVRQPGDHGPEAGLPTESEPGQPHRIDCKYAMDAGGGGDAIRLKQQAQLADARHPALGSGFGERPLDESEIAVELEDVRPENPDLNECESRHAESEQGEWMRRCRPEEKTVRSPPQPCACHGEEARVRRSNIPA